MKILIAGDWRWPQYEAAFAEALKTLGHEVSAFSFSRFFSGRPGRLQRSFPVPGPALLRLNRDLLETVGRERPDVVLVWRGTHVLPGTLRRIGRLGALTASYNNDDPFSPKAHGKVPWSHRFLWFWYLKDLPRFHRNFFYREANVREARSAGARHAAVLKPYFMPWRERPVRLEGEEAARFRHPIVFAGHYEPDQRVACLRALVAAGFPVKLYGDASWSRQALGDLYPLFAPVTPALGEDYPKALSGATICLAFLSKLNRDTYTRRCFEIPACGSVLLSERTEDLTRMFAEDVEACFFSDEQELVEKARWLLADPARAEGIARAGLARVWADGHDVVSRAAEFEAALTAEP